MSAFLSKRRIGENPGAGWLRLGALLGLLVLLTGCYLPDRFELNINIEPDGDYAFQYKGDLISVNFLRKIGAETVEGDDEDEIDVYRSDLQRDSGFKNVSYLGQARYRVDYARQNNIFKYANFSFVRRNGAFLVMKRNAEGLITLEGSRPQKRYRDELTAKGFKTRGVVRVWTSARVLDHNANQVQQGNPSMYVWNIEDINQEMPNMIIDPRS